MATGGLAVTGSGAFAVGGAAASGGTDSSAASVEAGSVSACVRAVTSCLAAASFDDDDADFNAALEHADAAFTAHSASDTAAAEVMRALVAVAVQELQRHALAAAADAAAPEAAPGAGTGSAPGAAAAATPRTHSASGYASDRIAASVRLAKLLTLCGSRTRTRGMATLEVLEALACSVLLGTAVDAGRAQPRTTTAGGIDNGLGVHDSETSSTTAARKRRRARKSRSGRKGTGTRASASTSQSATETETAQHRTPLSLAAHSVLSLLQHCCDAEVAGGSPAAAIAKAVAGGASMALRMLVHASQAAAHGAAAMLPTLRSVAGSPAPSTTAQLGVGTVGGYADGGVTSGSAAIPRSLTSLPSANVATSAREALVDLACTVLSPAPLHLLAFCLASDGAKAEPTQKVRSQLMLGAVAALEAIDVDNEEELVWFVSELEEFKTRHRGVASEHEDDSESVEPPELSLTQIPPEAVAQLVEMSRMDKSGSVRQIALDAAVLAIEVAGRWAAAEANMATASESDPRQTLASSADMTTSPESATRVAVDTAAVLIPRLKDKSKSVRQSAFAVAARIAADLVRSASKAQGAAGAENTDEPARCSELLTAMLHNSLYYGLSGGIAADARERDGASSVVLEYLRGAESARIIADRIIAADLWDTGDGGVLLDILSPLLYEHSDALRPVARAPPTMVVPAAAAAGTSAWTTQRDVAMPLL